MSISIKTSNFDTSLSLFRLTRPGQIAWMQNSLERMGQLQPVFVRKKGDYYELLDGFKRYYACQYLQWDSLDAEVVDADDITAKALIFNYNQHGSSLASYEEAQIIHSLKREHLMKLEEISSLLLRSSSWVSRRLSFIERLSDEIQSHLQLGKITGSHARELTNLPRGKQNDFLRLIINNSLTSRQLKLLVSKYLKSNTKQEQNYLLSHPMEIIEKQGEDIEIDDCRLSAQGNRLLRTMRILSRDQHIFIGQTTNPPLEELAVIELEILSKEFSDLVKKTKIIQSILSKWTK